LAELQRTKGVTGWKMSKELGHSTSYMRNIYNGRMLPSMSEFFRICEYLNTTPQDFFSDNEILLDIQKNQVGQIFFYGIKREWSRCGSILLRKASTGLIRSP